jgi:hypothetical protein
MNRLFIIVLILGVTVMNFMETSFAKGSKLSAISKKNARNAEIKLFNGKNLDGWYTFLKGKGRNNDPDKVFTVKNGQITISGKEFGCLTSNDEYENYKLLVEFKWGDLTFEPRVGKARDSGVLLHSTGEDGGYSGIWMYSIECQIIEGGTGDLLVVGDGTNKYSLTCPVEPEKQSGSYVFKPDGNSVTINQGRINWYGRDPNWKDVTGFRGVKDIERPTGKWNRLECIVKGKEILIYLNGKLVNHAIDVQPRKGHIQIQSEGAEIMFRRIDLIPVL